MLRRYFTNLDGPVFALVNLPEVVKGALFARYSRSPKSLRRLFLDEFVGDLDIAGDQTIDATIGLERAEELYEKVFFEYGDDSVAQLGGVHLACEQASNVLTKILEWGRLMSYLEQSTRYIAYDSRLGGRYRFYRDPHVLSSRFGTRYVGDMDRIFDAYSSSVAAVTEHVRDDDPAPRRRQRVRVPPGDAGQGARRHPRHAAGGVAVERRDLRHRARRSRRCCCGCAPIRSRRPRRYAELMLHELRKVIPSFLRRVDLPDRGGRWSDYLGDDARPTPAAVVDRLFGGTPVEQVPSVTLVDWDPDAEDKLLAAICYSHANLPEHSVARAGPAARRRRPGRARACVRRAIARTGVTSRVGRSSASTIASTCCPTTARSATCSGTACSRSSGSASRRTTGTCDRPDRRSGTRRAVRRGDGTFGGAVRRAAHGLSRAGHRTPWRWRTGSGT